MFSVETGNFTTHGTRLPPIYRCTDAALLTGSRLSPCCIGATRIEGKKGGLTATLRSFFVPTFSPFFLLRYSRFLSSILVSHSSSTSPCSSRYWHLPFLSSLDLSFSLSLFCLSRSSFFCIPFFMPGLLRYLFSFSVPFPSSFFLVSVSQDYSSLSLCGMGNFFVISFSMVSRCFASFLSCVYILFSNFFDNYFLSLFYALSWNE